MPDRFQTVRITLSDGRSGLFSGPALVMDGKGSLKATDILFYAPQPLPSGFRFAKLEDANSQSNEFDTKTKAQAGVRPPMAKSRWSGGEKKPHHERGGRKGKARQKA